MPRPTVNNDKLLAIVAPYIVRADTAQMTILRVNNILSESSNINSEQERIDFVRERLSSIRLNRPNPQQQLQ